MSNNISLNEVKNSAFLASESYKHAVDKIENSKTEILKNGVITNPTTNSSFEVIDQTESANGFSTTVFRNIPQKDWG